MTTWNPSDKTANCILSNGDLTATSSGPADDGACRATLGRNTGKWQFRCVFDNDGGTCQVGVATEGELFDYTAAPNAAYYVVGASAIGVAVDVAIDVDAGKIWVGEDGVFDGDPVAGTGAYGTFAPGTLVFPAFRFYVGEPSIAQVTGVFDAEALAPILLAGFSAYGAVPAPSYAEASTEATVSLPRGVAEAPTRALVYSSGIAEAPTMAVVLNTTTTRQWTATVVLGAVDISTKVTGTLTVTAEEGAARLAQFSFKPSPGVINPTAWTGTPVTIDIVRIFGALQIPTRVFTGVVDVADFDEVEQTVTFDCTDDLQNKVAALSKAEIDALVGGRYHVGVQGDIAEHWDYAQARMESVAGSLDAGPYGEPRVTLWDGLPVAFNFTGAAHVLGDTDPPAWRPQRRVGLVNEVLLTLKYRYYMCRERHAWLAWSKSIIGADALASGYQYPTQQVVESALSGAGWQVLATFFGNAPAQVPVVSPTGFYVAPTGVANMTAHLAQRHAQTVTEVHTIAVQAPASITANGLLSRPMRAVVEPDWTPQEWEGDFSVTTPDASGGGAGGEVAYAGTATRAEFEACYLTAVDVAKVKVLASHRKSSQEFAVPAMPEADLTWGAQITCGSVTASGKVGRLVHRVQIEPGAADTLLTLALSGIGSAGVVTPTAIAAPSPPDVAESTGEDDWVEAIPALLNHVGAVTNHAYSEDLMGFLVNAPETITITDGTDTQAGANPYYDADWAYPTTGFRVRMPGVRASHRNPIEIPLSETVEIEVPEGSLTLTVT